MQKSILENETYSVLWDFEILIDHLIKARRKDLMLINTKKKILAISWILLFEMITERKEIERENINKYWDFAQGLKICWNMKVSVITIVIGTHRRFSGGPEKRLGNWISVEESIVSRSLYS